MNKVKNLTEEQWTWIVIQGVISGILFVYNGEWRIQIVCANIALISLIYGAIKVWGE